jgi:hypothetical protein
MKFVPNLCVCELRYSTERQREETWQKRGRRGPSLAIFIWVSQSLFLFGSLNRALRVTRIIRSTHHDDSGLVGLHFPGLTSFKQVNLQAGFSQKMVNSLDRINQTGYNLLDRITQTGEFGRTN